MQDPPVKKILYWCKKCNIPLIGKTCPCGNEPDKIRLLMPYELRPALSDDYSLIKNLIEEKYGQVPISKVLLLNKTGGADRADLVIMNGERLGWLTFDPVGRKFNFDLAVEALPFILNHVKKGIVDIETYTDHSKGKGRIGGKRLSLLSPLQDGTVIVKFKNRFGTGIIRDNKIKIRELVQVNPQQMPDPDWDEVIQKNRHHLKNLERTAIRTIKRHINDRPTANISFSGGKDSTAIFHLAQKAGINEAFFIDTGLEFPETIEFIRSKGVEIIDKGVDFWKAVKKSGPPTKDKRWCCILLKLDPLNSYLAEIGPCVTVQGNRWYESWDRAGIEEISKNPINPLQLNISPIRNWRAFEVFLYLWWQKLDINPLYEKGIERIGCYLCPSMLESEYEKVREIYPEYAEHWDSFLDSWAEKNGFPKQYREWGLWRWQALPPKMREICKEKNIPFNYDFNLKTAHQRNKSVKEPAQKKKKWAKSTRKKLQ